MAVATMTNEAGSSELTRPIQELIASGKLRALQNDLLEGLKDDEDKGPRFDVYQISEEHPARLIGRYMTYSDASILCDDVEYHQENAGSVIVPHAFDYLKYVLTESVGIMRRAYA